MTFKHTYLIAFFIACGFITYQDIRNCHDLPWPPRLIATGLVFGFLDLFSIVSEELAGVMAFGIVLAFGMNSLPGAGVGLPGFGPQCKHPCIGVANTSGGGGPGFDIGGGIPYTPAPTTGPDTGTATGPGTGTGTPGTNGTVWT